MRAIRRVHLSVALGLCLLSLALGGLFRDRSLDRTLRLPHHLVAPPQVHTPFEDALREARWWQRRAMLEVNREREALESWDETIMGEDQQPQWQQMMAADSHGYLRRARGHALRAAKLARLPGEVYRAAVQLAVIECGTGDHAGELRQARKLRSLKPKDPVSLLLLRHAAECNGRELLARQAAQEYRALLKSGGSGQNRKPNPRGSSD